jgi:thiol-disulfide isomerase/thioredoxin
VQLLGDASSGAVITPGRGPELRGSWRGKVVLLDFWATWCTGCKEEIPSFSEFETTRGPKGFTMIGVSMDEGGWKVLNPFLAETKVPYPMLGGAIQQRRNTESRNCRIRS